MKWGEFTVGSVPLMRDGLSDGQEVLKLGTDPLNVDTDGDGLIDGYNRDAINDEYKYNSLVKINNKYIGEMSIGSNPLLPDTDHDGVNDGDEYQYIHAIGITDPAEISEILHSTDYDNDGMPDSYEYLSWVYANSEGIGTFLMLNYSADAFKDFDSDGLTNLEEYYRDPSGDFDGDSTPDIYDSNGA